MIRSLPAMLLALVAALPLRAENLLLNSSFRHQANPGIPSMWDAGGGKFRADWPACWRPEAEGALPGAGAMRLTNTGPGGLTLQTCYLGRSLPKGKPCTWSVYLRTDTPGAKARVSHTALGPEGKPGAVTIVQPEATWRRFTGTANVATDQAPQTQLRIEWSQAGTLWISAPQLEEGAEATAWTPSPLDPGAAATAAPARPAPAALLPLPRVRCPKLSAPPRIDGQLDDAVWREALPLGEFHSLDTGAAPTQATEVRLARDDDALYLAVRCREAQLGAVQTKAVEGRGANVWADDCVELFVSPYPTGDGYRHFGVNAAGVHNEEAARGASWHGPWQVKAGREAGAWTAEIALPFGSLSYGPGVGDAWRLNICRHRTPGGEELSSWSPTAGGFHQPERFGWVEGLGQPGVRAWQLGLVELRDGLTARFWSGQPRRGRLEVTGAKGEPIRTLSIDLPAGDRDVPLGPRRAVPGDTVRLRFVDQRGLLLLDTAAPLRAEPPLLEAWPGRNWYADAAQGEVAAHTALPGARVTVALAGAAPKTARTDDRGWTRVPVALPEAPGEYPATVRLLGDRDAVLAEQRVVLTVKPPGAVMVPWDPASGCLLVDGKPYIPLAIGAGGIKPEAIADMAAAGFSAVHVWPHDPGHWPDPAAADTIRALFDECGRQGLRAIPANPLMATKYETFAAWKQATLDLFMPYRDHPAILAWDMIDEPGSSWARGSDWNEGNLTTLRDAFIAADPWRPAFVNYYAWKPGYGFYGGLGSTDIYSMDCYYLGGWFGGPGHEPYRTYDRAMTMQTKTLDDIRADARRDGKPAHFWLHFYAGGDSYREPSIDENVGQTWLALIHGFRMLSYFVYRPMSLDLWRSIRPLRQEIDTLAPVLGTPELRGAVTSGNPAIHAAAFRQGGAWYLLTANATSQPVEATLALDRLPRGTASVLFEQRSLHTDGAKLADRWAPRQRHVYRLPEGGAR